MEEFDEKIKAVRQELLRRVGEVVKQFEEEAGIHVILKHKDIGTATDLANNRVEEFYEKYCK